MKFILFFTVFCFFLALVGWFKAEDISQLSLKTQKSRNPSSSEEGRREKKAQKTKQELLSGLEQHLNNLRNICSAEAHHQKALLEEELKALKAFLKRSLQDPYMVYTLRLEFGDLLSLMEQEIHPWPPLENFVIAYQGLYNLPENTKVEDYPQTWAKTIHNTLKCIEEK